MGDVTEKLRKALDFLKAPDFFDGKLKGGVHDFFFTPGGAELNMPSAVASALSYWAGLLISFQYAMNVGNPASVFPFGHVHFIDPSGLKGIKLQNAYFDWINFNHPNFNNRTEYNKPGKGIPDIITANNGNKSFIYYEIKPDNAAGLRDGREKLARIRGPERRVIPPQYQPGKQVHVEPLEILTFNAPVATFAMKVFVLLRVPEDGLILYKFRVRFENNPGELISRALIAIAVVALIEGGMLVLEGAAAEAGGTAVATAEEAAFQRVRVELMQRIAEEAGLETIGELGEQMGELMQNNPLKRMVGR